MLSGSNVRGTFDNLAALWGIVFDPSNYKPIISLFKWHDDEITEISSLKSLMNKQTLDEKKFLHLFYLLATAYSVALSPSNNLTETAGCHWQRQL